MLRSNAAIGERPWCAYGWIEPEGPVDRPPRARLSGKAAEIRLTRLPETSSFVPEEWPVGGPCCLSSGMEEMRG